MASHVFDLKSLSKGYCCYVLTSYNKITKDNQELSQQHLPCSFRHFQCEYQCHQVLSCVENVHLQYSQEQFYFSSGSHVFVSNWIHGGRITGRNGMYGH